MTKAAHAVYFTSLALWVGGLAALTIVAAPTIFKHASSRTAAGAIFGPVLSPDDRNVAVLGTEQGNRDIWIHDTVRGAMTRLTQDPKSDEHSTWSPNGRQIAFHSNRTGNMDIWVKQANGTGQARLLVGAGTAILPAMVAKQ